MQGLRVRSVSQALLWLLQHELLHGLLYVFSPQQWHDVTVAPRKVTEMRVNQKNYISRASQDLKSKEWVESLELFRNQEFSGNILPEIPIGSSRFRLLKCKRLASSVYSAMKSEELVDDELDGFERYYLSDDEGEGVFHTPTLNPVSVKPFGPGRKRGRPFKRVIVDDNDHVSSIDLLGSADATPMAESIPTQAAYPSSSPLLATSHTQRRSFAAQNRHRVLMEALTGNPVYVEAIRDEVEDIGTDDGDSGDGDVKDRSVPYHSWKSTRGNGHSVFFLRYAHGAFGHCAYTYSAPRNK
jgi:hypothetical protein